MPPTARRSLRSQTLMFRMIRLAPLAIVRGFAPRMPPKARRSLRSQTLMFRTIRLAPLAIVRRFAIVPGTPQPSSRRWTTSS
ncbi:hypothetical protein BN13_530001 [Nostocoides jenkinsii Ben 74]|uniref:Uncharacterized protein n=1 Tax=Nostocoides jenkinsii Ben 74 TaxID=1193518 RepID=A0A077M9G3_9MICO|nr:hypothetical protein BN13_530001 [Tetrasphaera jenkinsii Ben 74]